VELLDFAGIRPRHRWGQLRQALFGSLDAMNRNGWHRFAPVRLRSNEDTTWAAVVGVEHEQTAYGHLGRALHDFGIAALPHGSDPSGLAAKGMRPVRNYPLNDPEKSVRLFIMATLDRNGRPHFPFPRLMTPNLHAAMATVPPERRYAYRLCLLDQPRRFHAQTNGVRNPGADVDAQWFEPSEVELQSAVQNPVMGSVEAYVRDDATGAEGDIIAGIEASTLLCQAWDRKPDNQIRNPLTARLAYVRLSGAKGEGLLDVGPAGLLAPLTEQGLIHPDDPAASRPTRSYTSLSIEAPEHWPALDPFYVELPTLAAVRAREFDWRIPPVHRGRPLTGTAGVAGTATPSVPPGVSAGSRPKELGATPEVEEVEPILDVRPPWVRGTGLILSPTSRRYPDQLPAHAPRHAEFFVSETFDILARQNVAARAVAWNTRRTGGLEGHNEIVLPESERKRLIDALQHRATGLTPLSVNLTINSTKEVAVRTDSDGWVQVQFVRADEFASYDQLPGTLARLNDRVESKPQVLVAPSKRNVPKALSNGDAALVLRNCWARGVPMLLLGARRGLDLAFPPFGANAELVREATQVFAGRATGDLDSQELWADGTLLTMRPASSEELEHHTKPLSLPDPWMNPPGKDPRLGL
jgi:hypothetical protein